MAGIRTGFHQYQECLLINIKGVWCSGRLYTRNGSEGLKMNHFLSAQEGQRPQAQRQPSESVSVMSSTTVPGAERHLHHHAGRIMRSGKAQVYPGLSHVRVSAFKYQHSMRIWLSAGHDNNCDQFLTKLDEGCMQCVCSSRT